MAPPIILSWSGGKDSAMALLQLQQLGHATIRLLTTVSSEYQRISMHGVRLDLLQRQACALGCQLEIMWLPASVSSEQYEKQMTETLQRLQREGFATVAFGDLFLQDLRAYRENKLLSIGMQALFPVWGQDTAALARQFIALGFQAVVTCVDGDTLTSSFCGRLYDRQFLADLPATVDPCGENGEFHSFVYAGPIFSQPLAWTRGETVCRDQRFFFCDIIPSA